MQEEKPSSYSTFSLVSVKLAAIMASTTMESKMPKLSKFDRTTLAVLRADIDAALAEISKKHGITLGIGGITFTNTSFTTKISAAIVQGDTTAELDSDIDPRWIVAFNRRAPLYGFKSTDINKKFTIRNQEYTLVGWRPNAKHKIVARRNGKLTSIDHSLVLQAIHP